MNLSYKIECFSIGTGDPSDNLNPKTRGEKPIIPSADKFIEVSSNSIILHLSAWSDGGCPMLYFVLEHKKKYVNFFNQILSMLHSNR